VTDEPEALAVEPGWYPDPEDSKGKWLRYWDGEDWSETPPRIATAKEREELAWPGSPSPETLEDADELRLDDLVLLGGHGFPLVPKRSYEADFGPSEVAITGPGREGVETIAIAYPDLTNLSIGGPGEIKEGGGFIGGGFGVEGFAVGAAAAGVLNALTTRSRIETLLGMRTAAGELVFLCSSVDPQALELGLSRVRALVQIAPQTEQGDADPASQLSKLADLLERGYLDRDEFDRLKRNLLEDL